MPRPVAKLVSNSLRGPNLRTTIVLLTSAFCLAAWNSTGIYQAWVNHVPASLIVADDPDLSATIWSFMSGILFLGVVPLLLVKFVLREHLFDYGVRLGDMRFSLVSGMLAVPFLLAISYCSAQSPTFQAFYPLNPLARQSSSALAGHIVGQIFFYAAWEFHFRGFLQHGLSRSFTVPLAIGVQTLASALAHFGKPTAEVFASILGGLLWGALAWRTRSLLPSIFQHWLLGASLDFFICRKA